MKVAILTYYNVHNHGSSLQAFGLKRVLENLNCDVSFLTFDRNYDFIPKENSKKYKLDMSSIGFFVKYMFERGADNILFNLKKRNVLNIFTRNNLPVSGRYSDFEGDLVVIGSDEVFSVEVGINPFFYGVGLKASKVISYAASFGPTTKELIEKRKLGGMLRGCIGDLDAISVRDQNSKNLVSFYTGQSPALVVDPVILYGYKDEQKQFRPQDDNYIIVYSYDKNFNDKETSGIIKKYAREHGYRVYSIGYYHRWCDKNICPDPIEMLGYFKNAKIVVTDTFHGAVVSLITETQFVVKISGNKNKLEFLLSEYSLDNRIMDNIKQFEDVAEKKIDYEKVNSLLEENRQHSIEFLKDNMVEIC